MKPCRKGMLDYRVRVYRRYPLKEMRQVVIYLRPTNSDLVKQNSFRLSKTYHEFEVIRLWETPTEPFLQHPGLLPFAVLSQTNEPTMILGRVAQAIEDIADRNIKSNLTAASAILAGLVMPKDIIQRIFRSDIMQESVIYKEIYSEGQQKEKERVALSLLRQEISVEVIANATELPKEKIIALQKIVNQNNN